MKLRKCPLSTFHTGEMYSSVPTNEFDCVEGSATNVGGGWLLHFLLLS